MHIRYAGSGATLTDELSKIADDVAAMTYQFVDAGSMLGLSLPSAKAARFKARLHDAISILDDELGKENRISLRLAALSVGESVYGPTLVEVEEAAEYIEAGIRELKRKATKPSPLPAGRKPYVAPSRIAAIKEARGKYDLRRLAELCRELNVATAGDCHMATAMLVRAILDHVPPVFGFQTFAEVSSQIAGRTYKASFQRLQGSLRLIADLHLHNPVREREALPTATQVDFAADLDVLLGEVIRVGSQP